ncbi:hypothetical protein M501DRAFT_1018536 [Patellaria atrata CBS 101060]|uniref:Kinesin light chain n=1 Tax=Patellaria atrata CBS 101060 TaxID=1346257 RepID=A0A9P4S633_9PEZI|nr:hypothetical protein M501DRAFT_1018536 [Patellaria atrata CBS 101060]
METRKRVLGEEHPDTLTSMANLAFTFKLQTQILGPQHPYVISSVATLNQWELENVDITVTDKL